MLPDQQPASKRKLRVLVVEDEYFIADDIAEATAALGCEVLGPMPNVEIAEKFVSSGAKIDVAVLDINLRGRNAFELADQLTALDVPFVFATGYDSSAIPPRFRHVPLWDKPFDHAELASTVAKIATSKTRSA